jgi:hypothetical protein
LGPSAHTTENTHRQHLTNRAATKEAAMSVTETISSANTPGRSDHQVGQAHASRRLAALVAALVAVTGIILTTWHESNPPTAPTVPTPSDPPPAYLPGGSVYKQQVPPYPPHRTVYVQQVPSTP